jgi:hypothetical protein
MGMPVIGYLFPYIMCAEGLIDRMDVLLRRALEQYGDCSNRHLVAFRLPPNALGGMSPELEWVVYVALGVDEPIPKAYAKAPKLVEYGWGADVLPPSDALVYYRLLEANDPSRSTIAIGTVCSDDKVSWQYLEERMDADSYFWIRVIDNAGEKGTLS